MPGFSARRTAAATALLLGVSVSIAGCGSTGLIKNSSTQSAQASPTAPAPAPASGDSGGSSASSAPSQTSTPQQLGFPYLATKNTTRVPGNDPVSNAAAVALAVFPSAAPGTHPTAVALAPTGSWQDAIAASSLMASPFRAPVLLSTPSSLPTATGSALTLLAPTGDPSAQDAQVIRIGNVPAPKDLRSVTIGGSDPYTVAADIADFEAKQRGGESTDVVVTSAADAADAMPAAGWIAESGEPLLYVNASGVPAATAAQLKLHSHPRIYVLGSSSDVPAGVISALAKYGTVKRISGSTPAAESVNFATYRDPACPSNNQECAHIPHSFGWAIRTPGHGYVLINENAPLDAAAAAALSSSGGYGPQLLVSGSEGLPSSVLNFFLDYATPGYTSEGPTAAVYNHAWLIGNLSEISEGVQAQVDSILEAVPAKQ